LGGRVSSVLCSMRACILRRRAMLL
jgi:hypothetical protein